MATAVAENEQTIGNVAPNPGALTKALEEAKARKDKATAELETVRKSNNLSALIKFLGTHKAEAQEDGTVSFPAIEREIATAQRAVDQAAHAAQAEKRASMSAELHQAVHNAVVNLHARAVELGITGVGVIFADGKAEITVREKSVSTGKRGPSKGGTRARGKWQFNGQEYSSRELLLTFGKSRITPAVQRELDTTGGNWNAAMIRPLLVIVLSS